MTYPLTEHRVAGPAVNRLHAEWGRLRLLNNSLANGQVVYPDTCGLPPPVILAGGDTQKRLLTLLSAAAPNYATVYGLNASNLTGLDYLRSFLRAVSREQRSIAFVEAAFAQPAVVEELVAALEHRSLPPGRARSSALTLFVFGTPRLEDLDPALLWKRHVMAQV